MNQRERPWKRPRHFPSMERNAADIKQLAK